MHAGQVGDAKGTHPAGVCCVLAEVLCGIPKVRRAATGKYAVEAGIIFHLFIYSFESVIGVRQCKRCVRAREEVLFLFLEISKCAMRVHEIRYRRGIFAVFNCLKYAVCGNIEVVPIWIFHGPVHHGTGLDDVYFLTFLVVFGHTCCVCCLFLVVALWLWRRKYWTS